MKKVVLDILKLLSIPGTNKADKLVRQYRRASIERQRKYKRCQDLARLLNAYQEDKRKR